MTHRCKHVQGIVDDLKAAGATTIETKRDQFQVRITWTLAGRPGSIVTSSHPRDEVAAYTIGRQAMRRACREARVS